MGKFDEHEESAPPPIRPEDWPAGSTPTKPPRKANGGTGEPLPIVRPIPQGESAFALTEREMPDPVMLCDPWAVEGINIIAGRPKLGKTTFERQKLAAAAVGAPFLDSHFREPVKCAFLSLEEGELLCRMKFKMAAFNELALASIQLHFEWPRGLDGADLLDRYLTANPDIRLICIDSLTKFRTIPDPRTPSFMADYEAINHLHDVSKRHPGICIDVIHHTRKAKSEDPIDDISGTYGLTAASDAYMVMRHHSDGAVMYVGGRRWTREDSEYKLKRNGRQGWDMMGAFLDLTDKQQDALERVKSAEHGLSGSELASALSITIPSAWQRLDELLEKGLVTKRYGRVFMKM